MTVQQFRKKPVEIQAVQLGLLNHDEIEHFVGGDLGKHPEGGLVIATLEGAMRASVGDWIIKGVSGEFYPCKPDIFEKTYEAVSVSYPPDRLENHPDGYTPEDDGTMPTNVAELAETVVGRKIIKAELTDFRPEDFEGTENTYWSSYSNGSGLVLTLDDGRRVALVDTSDCCAHTHLEEFFLDPAAVDHVITGVATTDGYTKWHIFADFGDIMRLKVSWSSGNPFYYGYGFDIGVSNVIEGQVVSEQKEITS